MPFLFAWRQFKSHWHAGELRVLLMALILAVASVTAVSFFAERVTLALQQQGGLLLGGDMVVSSQRPIAAHYLQFAQKQQLNSAQTMEFPSMVLHGDASQLAEIKVLGQGFPLRGEFTLLSEQAKEMKVALGPVAGTVWVEPKLAKLLGVQVGDMLQVGEATLKLAALITHEPSRGGDMFSFAPRLMMNMADIEKTALVQFGSRIKYQLLLTGEPQRLENYFAWAKTKLQTGERVEQVADARPELKSALEKSRQFLGLSAMVSVILSVVAMFLASLPYVQNAMHSFALLRCLGASKRYITQLMLLEAFYLALVGAIVGVLLGYIAQYVLSELLGSLILDTLPDFTLSHMPLQPFLIGLVLSIGSMLAILWPHLLALREVSAMQVLRHQAMQQSVRSGLSYLPLFLLLLAMVFWQAASVKLAFMTIVGLLGLVFMIAFMAWVLLRLLRRVPVGESAFWKIGLAGLKRRPLLMITQSVGLSLGLMALVLLAFIKTDLMRNWQSTLPQDAPNRFVINIQPEQVPAMRQFFQEANVTKAPILPMIRGRLVRLNDQPFLADKFKDERARRLAEREFNLSVAKEMQSDNQLVAGRWWTDQEFGLPMISLEQGLAETLGIKLGDRLTYDIAGNQITLTVTSLRKVDWDTMRVNFFAVTPPGVLEQFDASYITSFYLPAKQQEMLQNLIKAQSNLTVIDVDAMMLQVRSMMNKMTEAIQFVFIFSVLSGVAVLYAALVSSRDERVNEATLLRVLGAKKRQVLIANMTEFLVIALLAAVPAVVAANVVAYFLSAEILHIVYRLNELQTLTALIAAVVSITAASWLVIRPYLHQSPRQVLHSI